MALLLNERTHTFVAVSVTLADTRAARRKGLLGRESISPDEAMVMTPCFGVHTLFMRFAIDVVFVDRDGRAVQIVHDLQPWRIAASLRACAVIEMSAGRARECDIQIGDRLTLSSSGPGLAWCRPVLSSHSPGPSSCRPGPVDPAESC